VKQKILVDGYNLIYHFPELRKHMERDLEESRDQFINHISIYAREKKVDIVVIFDGDGRTFHEPGNYPDIGVVFSNHPENADQLIKRLIDCEKKSVELTVVSSDREIADYARLSGVKALSSQAFAYLMDQRPDRDIEKKYDHSMSEEELKEWMQLFRRTEDSGDGTIKK